MSIDPNATGKVPSVIRSEYANDPDMREIIEMFVQEMPQRIAELVGSWQKGELVKVRRIAHQLKGAGGGYGFPQITTAAGVLESRVESLGADAGVEAVQALRSEVDSLVQLCRSVSVQ